MNKKQSPNTTAAKNPRALGRIEQSDDGAIYGWIVGPDPETLPIITVNGKSTTAVDLATERLDVNNALGVSGNHGFKFTVSGAKVGDKIKLSAIDSNGVFDVAHSVVSESKIEQIFLNQIAAAKEILDQNPSAVAVVCWDGAHNPIGRAKVLYEVASTQRKVVLFTYVSKEFGGAIWSPLQSSDILIVSVPWEDRERYHRAIAASGLRFDTVWICKPRLPGFYLAKQVSHADSSVILDHDDNEEHFSRSAESLQRPYGTAFINLTRHVAAGITSRTAASQPLCDDFGALMVRHARQAIDNVSSEASDEQPRRTVGFIGTVRPHKSILAAATAIKLFNWHLKKDVVFHVYGDIKPDQLVTELETGGVVVKSDIPSSRLKDELDALDVIITGYPSQDPQINKYQISSKIGDALMMGKPVLVPLSPSTEDLVGIDGIYLFDVSSFNEQLQAAMNHRGRPVLPNEFSLIGAYDAFEKAEQIAHVSPKAGRIFALLNTAEEDTRETKPSLVLIWKQHDAGLYGRRVDQIARSYKRAFPEYNVVILELLHESTAKTYNDQSGNFASERAKLMQMSEVKAAGNFEDDGVRVHQLVYPTVASLPKRLEKFLLDNDLLPFNTIVVQFPIINSVEKLACVLRSYKKVVDVVDNQFSWHTKSGKANIGYQYSTLTGDANAVVFNSEANKSFFQDSGLLNPDANIDVIENWYTPKSRFSFMSRRGSGRNAILYSGNMNDRIDWNLMHRIAGDPAAYTLHIAGTANLKNASFLSLLDHTNVIYYGPLSEVEVYNLLLEEIDVGIVCHLNDEVSEFMNPLKVHMYASAGVPIVSTNVQGIAIMPQVRIAENADEFLAHLSEAMNSSIVAEYSEDRSARYNALIEGLRSKSFSDVTDF